MALALTGVSDVTSLGGCNDAAVSFQSPVPLTHTTPPFVVPTPGSRMQLHGSSFGLNPVALAGLLATPCIVCASNHTFIDFVVGPGEGTGVDLKALGFQVGLTVAGQAAVSPTIRMR